MGSRTLQQCRSGVEQTPPRCRPRPALQLPKLPYQQRARIETEAARPMRPMQCAGKAGVGLTSAQENVKASLIHSFTTAMVWHSLASDENCRTKNYQTAEPKLQHQQRFPSRLPTEPSSHESATPGRQYQKLSQQLRLQRTPDQESKTRTGVRKSRTRPLQAKNHKTKNTELCDVQTKNTNRATNETECRISQLLFRMLNRKS